MSKARLAQKMKEKTAYKISNFDKQFIMDLFLDSDSVSSMNRLAIAVANVVQENHDTLSTFNELLNRKEIIQNAPITSERGLSGYKRINRFYEDVIRNLTAEEYAKKFKMKKSTVDELISFLKNSVSPGNISLDKKVHIFLWFLLNDISYNEVGILFGLHKSSVSHIFNEIASQLTESRYQFISWPSVEEQDMTRIKVNSRFGFPNCVGFIDTCRFKVGSKRCKKNTSDTVLLQAVCDESLMFIDIHVGDLGRLKKSKLYKESSLSKELKNLVDFDNHIIGDSSYKLKMNLITPFSSEELLTSEEMKFNEVHWKARGYIGHAFELLKERFRKLNCIDVVKPNSIQILISVTCILHNFILMHEGSSYVKEESICCDDAVVINTDIVKTAVEKRQFLCNYISYMEIDTGT